MNFHVGGCEPSPASTIFPVLVSVEPAVSLACRRRLCPASAANGSFLFGGPGPGTAEQDSWSGCVELVCGGVGVVVVVVMGQGLEGGVRSGRSSASSVFSSG